MKQSIRLGRIAGISVGAHWSTLVIALLVAAVLAGSVLPKDVPGRGPVAYWAAGAVTAVVFLAALLAHELAHAIVARRRGVPVTSITLWLLGGMTEFSEEARTPGDEFRVAVAGPLTSLLLAAVFGGAALLSAGPDLLVAAVRWLALMNAVLAVFNMLPGAPLDGGRVLHAVLWRGYRDRSRADRAAARAGQTLGMSLIALGAMELILLGWAGGLWLMLIGWFLSSAARGEGVVRAARDGLRGWSVRDLMTPHPDVAPAWQDAGEFVAGVALRSRQPVFPVVDFAGEPTGVVSLEALADTAPERRRGVRISALARPLDRRHRLAPDDDAVRVLEVPAFSGDLVAVVVDAGRVVGMVTTADLSRALRQAVLRATLPGGAAAPPSGRRPSADGGPADGTVDGTVAGGVDGTVDGTGGRTVNGPVDGAASPGGPSGDPAPDRPSRPLAGPGG
ncbi:putative zinc metalloprotease Rip3 [Sphaerisporangium rufum]|uniref:Zinc metalloprotease Rip3 n=1 Tax=Sphaerisporangium rufum TaxID=1381558 RepID=A0A919V429_9ACTN|nr:site-2 protease family protein [Sphaerisporangium rufum]GII81477.1 putative zinc metalloprotease Rip3 [Sphaerisporangium rufum]